MFIESQNNDFGKELYKALFAGSFDCLKSGFHVSSIKLFLIGIDSVYFIDSGKSNLGNWLKKYAKGMPDKIEITSQELVEHRNSLIHYGGLDSKGVKAKRICRLIPVLKPAVKFPGIKKIRGIKTKFYYVDELFVCLSEAIDSYIDDVNGNKNKKTQFIKNMKKVIYDVK
ncbi:MAG: hypothetical protein HQK83_04535 [Fibrobacteria bacterium]|nr:hypothetical protein [Fibrobacteria bacterium]